MNDPLVNGIRKLIANEIERLSAVLAGNQVNTLEGYKHITGKIAALHWADHIVETSAKRMIDGNDDD
jgi:hypothetical protein